MAFFRKNKKKINEDVEIVLPNHIGIIMDGNGRWAKKRGLPRVAGHTVGASTFRKIATYANKIGIKYMTTYAFSTENWKRSPQEIEGIMNLLRDYLKDAKNYKEENIKTVFIGDRSVLAPDIQQLMAEAEEGSKDATGMVLNIAVNYGGRADVVRAVRSIADKVKAGEVLPEDISEEMISDNLYTASQDEPDLIIRPSGEYRLSNFLIWQCAYAEFWFSDILWPDFSTDDLDEAIRAYSKRNRRFGDAK